MSTKLLHHVCALLAACLFIGCGGGDSETDDSSNDTSTDSAANAPEAPSSPSGGGGTPAATAPSSGTRINASTPDGAVREAVQAARDMEFERIWDLLPSSMQTNINGVFQEFGNQVDAELWDKSFNLLKRYVKVIVAKQEMVYQAPDGQQNLGMLKSAFASTGARYTDFVTEENIKSVSKPANELVMTILNSELTNSKKLKSFDGREFCANTLNPLVGNVRDLILAILAQIEKRGIPGDRELPAFLTEFDDLNELLDGVQSSTESMNGDFAVVAITSPDSSTPVKMNFVRVDGKWVPEMLGSALPGVLSKTRAMMPSIVGAINAQKAAIMPTLEQLEPLVGALEKAKTQEEFNTAYAQFNTQASQIAASAPGMPGVTGRFGGGPVKVSPVTIEFQGEVTDEQLGEAIEKLEALTDNPQKAITLPKRDLGQLLLEIHPVSDPQAFASSIQFAKRAEYDAARNVILLELEPPPAKPAETSESSEPGENG